MLPAVSIVGVSPGGWKIGPLWPNHSPPAFSSAARRATASPPSLALPAAIGPTRFDTTTRRRLGSATRVGRERRGFGASLGRSSVIVTVSLAAICPPPEVRLHEWNGSAPTAFRPVRGGRPRQPAASRARRERPSDLGRGCSGCPDL